MQKPIPARTAAPVPLRTDRPAGNAVQQLSHDIRAAMSDVLGGLRLIDQGRLDLQTLTQVERVRAAADTLAMLVDDAFLAATGDVRGSEPSASVELAALLTALSQRFTGRAEERGGQFHLRAHGTLPKRLKLAPVALDRILGNLVGNALIHGPGSQVWVDVMGDHEAGLTIQVCDDGPGFPDDVLAAFEDGRDTGAAGPTGGSGLGLGIVRALSAEIGAPLALENDPETGAAVARLRLPATLLDWSGDTAPDHAAPELDGLRILVAEDNLTNQVILRQMLSRMGAEATFVEDGMVAVEALESATFDIALVDIEMPRLTGLQVMERVRAGPAPLCNMPMVAITAYVLRDNREAIYAAGADGIIGKPIAAPDEFGRAILRHVGRPTGQPEPDDFAREGWDEGLDVKMDHDRLDRLLQVAGPDGRAELLQRLSEDLRAVAERLAEGVAQSSIAEIRAQTHILIAISGAVGADRLCQMAEVLNIAAKRKRFDTLAEIHKPVRADLLDLLALIDARRG